MTEEQLEVVQVVGAAAWILDSGFRRNDSLTKVALAKDSLPAYDPFAAMGRTPPADSMSFQKWQET